MSVSFGCKCKERLKPVEERNWVILQNHCRHSAFDGYKWAYSDYSTVHCLTCGTCGRTKAKYVDYLRDAVDEDFSQVAKGLK